jgi:hypothetical protein
MKAIVIVPRDFDADEANRLYGDAYGVDWEYEPEQKRTA